MLRVLDPELHVFDRLEKFGERPMLEISKGNLGHFLRLGLKVKFGCVFRPPVAGGLCKFRFCDHFRPDFGRALMRGKGKNTPRGGVRFVVGEEEGVRFH